jgi:peroxiredoxin
MPKIPLTLILFLSGFFVLSGCNAPQGTQPKAEAAESGLDFTLTDSNGGSFTLSDYRGKNPVLLLFWTTWCPYCRDALRKMNTEHQSLAQEGLMFAAVNIGEADYKVENFIKVNKLACKVLLDKDRKLAHRLEILGIPVYILIDKSGKVIYEDNSFPRGYKDLLKE